MPASPDRVTLFSFSVNSHLRLKLLCLLLILFPELWLCLVPLLPVVLSSFKGDGFLVHLTLGAVV